MEVKQQLLFFFSAVGAFNGLLLAGYLLFVLRPARLSNRLLGLLLLALSVRIGKSVFLNFDNDLARIYLQIGLTACFFIGPLLWAYLKASRDEIRRVPKSWWLGFGALVFIAVGIGLWRPYPTHPEFWSGACVEGIYAVWSLGIIGGGWLLWPVIQRRGEWKNLELWWVNVWAGNLVVHLAYRYGSYGSYIVGALSFSFVFYLLGLWHVLRRRQVDFLVAERPKYGDKKIDTASADRLLRRCDEVMLQDRLYLDANFKLADLAAAIDHSPHQVSQLLNDNADKSFAAYLRGYRVDHARRAIRTDDHLTLEAIGQEAGFGSKSAFYAAFREETGTTPAKYRKNPSRIIIPNG